MMRQWLLGGIVLGLLAASVAARPGIVKLQNGQSYEGDLEEQAEFVIVRKPGTKLEVRILRTEVAAIEYPPSFEEQYTRRLAALDEKDVAGRVALSRWAFDQRQYDVAVRAAEEALRVDPNSVEATTMLETVQRQIRLEKSAAQNPQNTGRPPADPNTADNTTGETAPVESIKRVYLTDADINKIKLTELRTTDTGVRINFERGVVKRYAERNALDFRDFDRLPAITKALEIRDKGTEEMVADLKVISDPASMLEYRRNIQPIVLAGCAATGCHSGPAGGSLILFDDRSEAAAYTNFYILQSYSRNVEPRSGAGGLFGGAATRKMIDRSNPSRSLLAEYGLPVDLSDYDHPQAQGWKHVYRNKEDRNYKRVIDWISQSLSPVEPNYGVSYTPPSATTKPSTQPAN